MKLPLLFALTVVLSVAVGYWIARWQAWNERHHGHELKARGGFIRPMATPYTLPPLDDEVTVIRHFPGCSMVKLTKEEHRRLHNPARGTVNLTRESLNVTPLDNEHCKKVQDAMLDIWLERTGDNDAQVGVFSCLEEE